MTKELNCCGLACPEPVIRCRRMLEEEKPASLRVFVDNTAASENVSRFLGRNGYSVEVRQEGAALWSVSATSCGCRVTEPEPAAATLTPGKTLVLITTETFGRGNDELGEKLMGNFLATLPELGEPVARHSAERRREARRHPRKITGQPEGSGKRGDGRPRLRNLP